MSKSIENKHKYLTVKIKDNMINILYFSPQKINK